MSRGIVRGEKGFTLVELLIAMAIFVVSLALISNFFTGQLTLFKQQSKLAETNIEGIIGLEILRQDIEHAGYGLPWELDGATYDEATNDGGTSWNDTDYNDSTGNPPRALVSGAGAGLNGSDVIVVKATTVAANTASQKWAHLFEGNTVTKWDPSSERLVTDDRVIVLRPGSTGTSRTLALNGTSFTTRYVANADPANDNLLDPAFAGSETRVVYGVTSPATTVTAELRMPFNRADYYVRRPSDVPLRCAPGTGVLFKATVDQGSTAPTAGGGHTELPLLDCVAAMRVLYVRDTSDPPDGISDSATDDISGLNAQQVRDQVREVRVYILAHEGQRDNTFKYSSSIVTLGEDITIGATFVGHRDITLSSIAGSGWQNYRWKVYTIVVKPDNLGRKLS